MHELALMDDLVQRIVEETPELEVHAVRLELRATAGGMADVLRSCFEACTNGTPLEGATLEIMAAESRSAQLEGALRAQKPRTAAAVRP